MYEAPANTLPDGPYTPTWESLSRVGVPDWYADAKFGIFIHWGPYCVPAFGNEWYPRNMYLRGTPEFAHHVARYGPQSQFGYKDFIPLMTGERFDAAEWVRVFCRAGARYIVPVAEHHDGFAMYDSALSRWNAAKMGPRRDVIGELAAAARAHGVPFGLSNHRAEHWWYMEGGREFDSDVQDPTLQDFYGPALPQSQTGTDAFKAFKADWLARAIEQVEKYCPSLVYFDTWVERPPLAPYRRHFAAHYYNLAHQHPGFDRAGVVINYKNDAFAPGSAVIDVERGQMGEIQPIVWQSCTSTGLKSWGYVEDEEYKSAEQLVCDLADVVSKNGNLLLNIGPKADGSLSAADLAILDEIGRWLDVYGDAIYGTRPWRVFGEGPTEVPDGHFTDRNRAAFTAEDWRFTTRGRTTLYAICLGRPRAGGEALIRSLGGALKLWPTRVSRVSVPGAGEVPWRRDAEGLWVRWPDPLPTPYGCTIQVKA